MHSKPTNLCSKYSIFLSTLITLYLEHFSDSILSLISNQMCKLQVITFKLTANNSILNYQFNSVAQLCLILCNPMDCSTSGFLVHHQPPELAQTHVH